MNLPTLPAFDLRTARTWANISLSNLIGNLRTIHQFVGSGSDVIAVVKADAYGHGAIPVARACMAAGIRHIAVATVMEAEELRHAGVSTDLYVMPSFLPEEAELAIRLDVTPFISSREQFITLSHAARKAPFPVRCFVAVDSGMGREGCLLDEAGAIFALAARQNSLRITGIATHFACADEENGVATTESQIATFYEFLSSLDSDLLSNTDDGRGNRGIFLTLCNSPATVRFPLPSPPAGVRTVLYRAGLLLYGIEPYTGAFTTMPDITPVLSWYARVTLIKTLPAGTSIGYGHTHTLSRTSQIATIATGYADGLSRRLSNCGTVLIQGQRFPIVGRVSMDQCQIDITDAITPVTVGAIATIIGRDTDEQQTVADLATLMETTPHELPCALTRRVRRLYSYSVPAEGQPSPPSQDNHQ